MNELGKNLSTLGRIHDEMENIYIILREEKKRREEKTYVYRTCHLCTIGKQKKKKENTIYWGSYYNSFKSR